MVVFYIVMLAIYFILCISYPEFFLCSLLYFLFIVIIPGSILYSLFESNEDTFNKESDEDTFNKGRNDMNSIDDIFDD